MVVKPNKLGNLERLGGANLTKIKFTRAINRYVEHLNGEETFLTLSKDTSVAYLEPC